MNRINLMSAVVFSTAIGLASSVALAHDGDALPTSAHAVSDFKAPVVDGSVRTADASTARNIRVERPAAMSRMQFGRDRQSSMINGNSLSVPNHPEFGRIGTP